MGVDSLFKLQDHARAKKSINPRPFFLTRDGGQPTNQSNGLSDFGALGGELPAFVPDMKSSSTVVIGCSIFTENGRLAAYTILCFSFLTKSSIAIHSLS